MHDIIISSQVSAAINMSVREIPSKGCVFASSKAIDVSGNFFLPYCSTEELPQYLRNS